MTLEFIDRFSKSSQISNFMKIRSVGDELFMRTDGQTCEYLNVAFRNFASTPNKVNWLWLWIFIDTVNARMLPDISVVSLSSRCSCLLKEYSNHLITVHFGPCEEDRSNVWEREVYSGRHPISKRTWDIGVVEVIKRGRNQAIAIALGGKCRKDRSGRFLEVVYSKPLAVSVETR